MTQEDRVEFLLQQGHEELDRGQEEAALATFQQAAAREPDNPRVLYGLGLACYRLERYRESVRYLTEALQVRPSYILALARRGMAYQKLNENEQGRADFERAISIEPQYYKDWECRGLALNDLERYEEAIASYDKAIEIKPDYNNAWYNKGVALMNLGHYEEEIASYDKAIEIKYNDHEAWNNRGNALNKLGKYEEAIVSFDKAIEIKPDFHYAWNSRGIALNNLGRYSEEIASYDKAIEIKPDFQYAWGNRGIALKELGRYEEAIASYDKAIEIKPDDHYAYNNRGVLLCDCLKRYEEAIASFDKAIEIKPDYHSAWGNRGNALNNLGRYEEAIASYDKAIEIKPDYHDAWGGKGSALGNLGRYKKAIACYDRALEIKPDYHYAWYNKGIALNNLGRYEEAILCYNKAIEIKPDYHYAWYSKNRALKYLRRNEQAIAFYEKVVEIQPDDQVAWGSKGNAMGNLGRYKETLASFDQAIEIQPDDQVAWQNRGMAMGELGRYEEALASFDRAIKIQPDDQVAWQNRGVAMGKLGRYLEAIASYDKALRLADNQNWQLWGNRGVAVLYSQGYEAAIKNCDDGIFVLQPQTPDYQQGMGELHSKKASYQYGYGTTQPNPFPSWLEAKQSYEAALKFLTFQDFPLRHLEVLQEYLKVCNALGDTQTIQQRLEKGTQQLEELLRHCEVPGHKITLSQKFAPFDQLRVDAKAESSDKQQQIQALELAERRKNTCLSWYQHGWQRAVPETTYQEMQQLLDKKTAIIYWHLSPAAITTFILRHKKPPLVQTLKPESSPQKRSFFGLFRQQATSEETAHLKAAKQLEAFEEWMKTWQQDYQNYREAKEKNTSSWRVQMPARLRQLAEVLDIPAILPHLQDIERLILIPHRQLHLLPLHYLFNIVGKQQFAISYLPSARIGIDLQRQATSQANYLLNVEQAGLLFTDLQHATISQLFPNSRNLRGPAVTPADLIEALSRGAGIFHFAGHADHDLQDPLNSALQLMNAEKLTLKDIFTVTLSNYHLVCLSACETGMTSQQNLIDEYVGLVSGFVRMGVTHVLSSLWTVQEDVTTMLLIRFYQFLKLGVAPVLALQQSQEWLRSVTHMDLAQWYGDLADEFSGSKRIKRIINGKANSFAKMEGSEYPYAHPYYWAAYFLTGIER